MLEVVARTATKHQTFARAFTALANLDACGAIQVLGGKRVGL